MSLIKFFVLAFVMFIVFDHIECLDMENLGIVPVVDICEDDPTCGDLIRSWFNTVNDESLKFNVISSKIAWIMVVGDGDEDILKKATALGTMRSNWQRIVCKQASTFPYDKLDELQKRQLYLLCRTIIFTNKETRDLNRLLNEMQTIYTASKICIPIEKNLTNSPEEYQILHYLNQIKSDKISMLNISDVIIWKAALMNNQYKGNDELKCFTGEPDLERIMSESRRSEVLKWTWLVWREAVGPPIKPLYKEMVKISNEAARRNGFLDVGDAWREELEIPNLKELMESLYGDVKDLYELLHAVTTYFVRRHYGIKNYMDNYIEAHLMGNMWGQTWDTLVDMIVPLEDTMDLNAMIKRTNWTAYDMVKRAEDFYMSLGLPAMTGKFWKYSQFNEKNATKSIKCHGTAANMYQNDDYRMIYCAKPTIEDFYVFHHELGHIQYYMAYDKNLPTIFKDGTNSALQESIGDAIMLGVMSPQHLFRLKLITDKELYLHPSNDAIKDDKSNFDEILLLRQGLSKIPQVPFGYLIDMYRWNIFSGNISSKEYNKIFWDYVMKYQGFVPPNDIMRGEKYFDAAAKYHVPDNTPYVRYFLSSFIQMQLFKGFCQLSLYGVVDPRRQLPMPLHRCDIYGSRKIGRKLKEVMSKGASIRWSEALYELTGEDKISSKAFLEYFEPLKNNLITLIKKFQIPVGW